MSDSSTIIPHRLMAQPKVTLEALQKKAALYIASPLEQMDRFESEMAKIDSAFILMREIRQTLEAALRDLA